MRALFRELTASNGMLRLDDLLGQVGVFQCPETQKTLLQSLCAVDFIFTITYGNEIGVG
jgi:hypothetical protein